MAETKKAKPPKSRKAAPENDSFADDLDSMLNLDATAEQQVGFIDDDDAIDRLLIDDAFQEREENVQDSLTGIDQLLASDDTGRKVDDIDEFADDIDDLISQIQLEPEPVAPVEEELSPVDEPIEELNVAGSSPADKLDTFSEELSDLPEIKTTQNPLDEELENMSEIDEFSEQPADYGRKEDNFLLADFDISADDDLDVIEAQPVSQTNENPALQEEALLLADDIEPESSQNETEQTLIAEEPIQVAATEDYSADIALAPAVDKYESPDLALIAEHTAALASLGTQIQALSKQQSLTNKAIQLKSSQEELNTCLETLDGVQSEIKKAKRHLEALNSKKPVSAYVAIGIAALALLAAIGLGIQLFIANSQVTQLVEMMGTLQTQVASGPTNDAVEKEMLRKQLDELMRANTANTEQISAINKSLQGESADKKPTGDLGKQLEQLSHQDMQMGATIEALQSKMAALQKGKPAVTPKPVVKKPEVVHENWVVNLVAFKQDWYAKRKAEEFAGKGVPAKVIKTDTKGENWYRLSVDGFSSQYEAAAYAARVKKTLNLDSVWVSKNK